MIEFTANKLKIACPECDGKFLLHTYKTDIWQYSIGLQCQNPECKAKFQQRNVWIDTLKECPDFPDISDFINQHFPRPNAFLEFKG